MTKARMTDKRNAHWIEEDAREVLDEWRRSGDSLAGFARKKGLIPERLSWWKKRLRDAPGDIFEGADANPGACGDGHSGGRAPATERHRARDLQRLTELGGCGRGRAGEDRAVILVPRAVRVYFATQPVNLRRSFDG